MTVTPLYTDAELDVEIAQAKKDLSAARSAISYTRDIGGQQLQQQRDKIEAIQKHLEWLQGQRVNNSIGSGPQSFAGRVRRG